MCSALFVIATVPRAISSMDVAADSTAAAFFSAVAATSSTAAATALTFSVDCRTVASIARA